MHPLTLEPLDQINGFSVRPGLYEINGAMVVPGGVNFTIHSLGATSCELLFFHRKETVPYATIQFPSHYRIGHVYSMIIFGLDIEEFEYAYCLDGPYDEGKGLLFDKKKPLLDIYAKAVTGQSVWGTQNPEGSFYKARVVQDRFDWGKDRNPLVPMEDLVIYELHVRGFTRHASSGVSHPGTFSGIMEKIPYLKELGVNIKAESDVLSKISDLAAVFNDKIDVLEDAVLKAKEFKSAEQAKYIHDMVIPAMEELRSAGDELETLTAEEYWPFPSYGEMMFSIK